MLRADADATIEVLVTLSPVLVLLEQSNVTPAAPAPAPLLYPLLVARFIAGKLSAFEGDSGDFH